MLFALLGLPLAACTSAPAERLPEGTWTGTFTPMNHPDMHAPVTYDVRYADAALALSITAPDGTPLPARDVAYTADALRFTFDEPDANVPLDCTLDAEATGFAGRCTDAEGKWARFTMRPPEK